MEGMDEYQGSRILLPIGDYVGMKIDHVNLIAYVVVALVVGYVFRTRLGPHNVSSTTRHLFLVATGTAVLLFHCGLPTVLLLLHTFSCYYLTIWLLPYKSMPKIITFVAMAELCAIHLYRRIYCFHSHVDIEISSPIMINAQRMAALAWSLHDGKVKDTDKLSANQRRLAVSKVPSILELLSYTMNFYGSLFGPFSFFKDHIAFVEGTNLIHNANVKLHHKESNGPRQLQCSSPAWRVTCQIGAAIMCLPVVLVITPMCPLLAESDIFRVNDGFSYHMFYIFVITETRKVRFFLVWKLAEALNNCAGMGYYIDENGVEKWDLVDNVHILPVMFATNMKMFLDNWNISATYWLRYVVYDRTKTYQTAGVFLMSAIWHGFHPGQYMTTFNACLFVFAARLGRRKFRPWFSNSVQMQRIYDVLTTIATFGSISYLGFPFQYRVFFLSIEIYKQLYFWLHIVVVTSIIYLLAFPGKSQKKIEKKES